MDGPFRSLNMRSAWKKVAEYSQNHAFSLDEISDSIISALRKDWRDEVPTALVSGLFRAFADTQGALFPQVKAQELEALRVHSAGRSLASLLLECAMHRIAADGVGLQVAVQAVEDTLLQWGSRHSRQVEEHYCRESFSLEGRQVRMRIDQGIGRVPIQDLANEFLKVSEAVPRLVTIKSGIDEGVPL